MINTTASGKYFAYHGRASGAQDVGQLDVATRRGDLSLTFPQVDLRLTLFPLVSSYFPYANVCFSTGSQRTFGNASHERYYLADERCVDSHGKSKSLRSTLTSGLCLAKLAQALGLGLRLLVPPKTFAVTRPTEKLCDDACMTYVL